MEGLLAEADIRLQGDRPWDIRLLKPGVPERVLARNSVGLGEAYMDGQWTAERLDQFFERLLRARVNEAAQPGLILAGACARGWFNLQNERRAWQVGRHHYDLGNDFYRAMLDPRMTYTCGYWNGACDARQAQQNKLDLVCRKLGLRRGMRVLDIGCGWGSLMRYAAETLRRQLRRRDGLGAPGRARPRTVPRPAGRIPAAGLPADRRPFDAVVSLGMFEHVGERNYRTYMEVVHRCLRDDGLFLLHTIGRNEHGHGTDPWVDKYIFPERRAADDRRASAGPASACSWSRTCTISAPTTTRR